LLYQRNELKTPTRSSSGASEPGSKPVTSCLQIRTTESSTVAANDQTGDSADDDPDLARSFGGVCRKCLPPACLPQRRGRSLIFHRYSWRRSQKPRLVSCRAPCSTKARGVPATNQLATGLVLGLVALGLPPGLLAQRPARSPGPSGTNDDWPASVSCGGREVNGPCAAAPSTGRHHEGLARGPPRLVGLGDEKDRAATRSLNT